MVLHVFYVQQVEVVVERKQPLCLRVAIAAMVKAVLRVLLRVRHVRRDNIPIVVNLVLLALSEK
tara:strand:- start:602 stop:793 length:192 start_codon:yes stop_codon:yes gene_type:complete